MRRMAFPIFAFGTAIGVALGIMAIKQARAELALADQPLSISKQELHQTEVQLQCWQNGVQVINLDELQGLSVSAASQTSSASFKRQNEEQPTVFILSFGDSLCLASPVD
jgi:hypothetical protein